MKNPMSRRAIAENTGSACGRKSILAGWLAALLIVPVSAVYSADGNSSESETDLRIEALVRNLNDKQKALDSARQEIVRLRGMVKKILAANRREKSVMYYNMGCMYKAAGEYENAEKQFLKALEKAPSDPDIHYNLGVLYDDDLDDSRKARHHYERFLELSPDDKDAARVREWLLSLD